MKNYNSYSKGSLWNIWDLHIHTPGTKLNDNYSGSDSEEKWQNFINKVNQTELVVLGITDYFCIDSYIKAKEYFKKNNFSRVKLLLPNIEFRISQPNKDGEFINIHIIFSSAVTIEQIEKFLGRLQITSTTDRSKKLYCDKESLKKEGYENITVSFEILRDQLNEDFNKGKDYLVAICPRGYGNYRPQKGEGRGNKLAVEIDKFGDMILGNHDDVHFFLDTSRYDKALPKPVLSTSDAHSLDQIGQNYSWLKANPTFEGLKQIPYEPEFRIKIQQHKLENKTDYLVIDKVKFIYEGEKKIFSDEYIELNPNLNCIIGGKSSGKSLLLYNIARTIDMNEVLIKDKDGSIAKSYEGKDSSYDFEVIWGDGHISTKKDISNSRTITYVPQLYISKLIDEEGLEGINKLVIETIKNSDKVVSDGNNSITIENFYEEKINEIRTFFKNINDLINELFYEKDKQDEIIADLKPLGDEKAINDDILKKKDQIDSLTKQSQLSQKETSEYNRLNKIISSKSINSSSLSNTNKVYEQTSKFITDKSENFINDLLNSILNFKEKLDNDPSAKNQIEIIITEFSKSIRKSKEEALQKIKNLISINNNVISSLSEEIQKSKDLIQPILSKISNQELLAELQKEIDRQNSVLTEIKEKKKQLNQKVHQVEKIKNDISTKYANAIELYNEVLNVFNKDELRNIDGLEIISALSMNKKLFREQFSNLFDNRSYFNKDSSLFNQQNEIQFDLENHVSRINDLFEKLFENKASNFRLTSLNVKDAITKLFEDYYEIKFDIKYRGDSLLEMSPGKRGLVLIQLYLQLSNARHPILIDQPEENLDNRTIYNDLVDFLKRKKTERQILIVTHNPNLVVSTDAEQIIVCNQAGQVIDRENREYSFEYVTGALEHSFEFEKSKIGILFKMGIREHVCDILEGGEEAFAKRERKYGFR